MSRLPKGFIASTSQEGQEAVERNTLCVTLLSREWRSSSDRDLSTVNRELAIQLAKHPGVQVSVFLPRCSEDDKRIAASHKVQLIEAEEMTGVDPVDWLINIPEDHVMDCIIGHGVHLGRQIPVIQQGHQCKWIQIVHNVPEALAMYKNNADAISRAEKMQQTEIELCELADQVVAVGPKLADTCRRFIRSSEKHQDVIDLTPSIFTEFLDVKQAVEERQTFCVLVIGSGDSEDFNLKGYDLAAQAIAELKETSYQLKFVCAPRGRGDEIAEKLLEHDIDRSQLIVRSFNESRETLARLFCEVDLAIMPSRSEGFGLTALEALSAGLPVLVRSNSGLGEALMKVPTGSNCVVDSEDPKHWASKIKAVRGKDRDVRLAESKLLREKYLEKYSWEKHCGVLVEKMQKLVTGSYGHSGPPSFLKYSQSPFPAGPQTPAQTYQTGHPQSSSSHDRPPSSLEHNQSHFLADCQTPVQTYQTSHPQSSFSHDRPPSLLEHKTGPQTPVQTYQTSHPQSSSVQGRPPLSVEHNQLSFPACSQTPVQTSQTQSHHPQIYCNMASPWPIADIKGHLSEIVNEKEDVNILILGEIGVGKSTWINGIANYAKHNTLRDAMDDPEFTVLISSRFFFTTDEGEEKEISFGSDANEVLESGQSATQFPQEHVLETDTTRFHLIDTPGIGDCRGIEKDKENVQNILAFLTCYNKLNSVVVLLKPNCARLTVAFKFCVLEMLTHLHRSLVSNIIFAFTNSRGTFYRPGDSLPVLKKVLQRNKIEINVSPSNYFCFDNEAFRFLACYKSGIYFTSEEVDIYSRSWVKSWDTTCKLFDLVKNLKPHDTKKTLSLNEARNCIIAMNKPMDQAVQLIEINLQKIKEVSDQCKVLSADIRSFQAELHFKGVELEIKELDHPMTVCAAETCKKYVNIGKSGERNTVYEQVCHDHCYCLKEMPDGTTNKEQLRECLAMFGGKCTQCSFNCDYTVHMRIDHTCNLVEKEFLSGNAQRKIKELSDLKSERKSFIEELEKKTRELQNEKDFIYDCASYYGVFLKENAIIPYNDSFREYLDMLIMEEEANAKVIRDDKKIQNLKKDKQAYEMKKDAIMTNIASGCKDKNEFIPLEMIYEMRQKLCSLKHNGKTLKKALDGVISARQRQYGLKRKSRVVARTKNNSQGTSSLARFNPFSRKANFNPRYY